MATLVQFRNFHGMLIGPSGAQKCISAFDEGVILFMPSNRKTLEKYHYRNLSLFSYYSLVLASFTGFCTFLGFTDFILSKQSMNGIASDKITDDILDYIAQHSEDSRESLKIIRHFKYDFKLPNINVDMWHLTGDTGVVHLVEIYESQTRIAQIYTALLIALVSSLVGYFL
jgi:hypothetical protein